MARISYKQKVIGSLRQHLLSDVTRHRLLGHWKESGFLLEECSSLPPTTPDNYPDHFEQRLDVFGSETLKFQEFEFFQMLLQILPTIRYLAPRNPLPKSSDFATRLIVELPENRFMRYFRMGRCAFNDLIDDIKDVSEKEDNTLPLQLGITLYRLGHTHETMGEIACLFGIGEGTVQLFFDRMMLALLKLRPTYLRWPGRYTLAHRHVRQTVEKDSNFPGCMGYLDGSIIGFKYKPHNDASSYWSGRKKKYGMNLQAICDSSHRFYYVSLGYPGSVQDSTAFSTTDISINPYKYLNPDEYFLADKGYPCTTRCMTPYKRPLSHQIQGGYKRYNEMHTSARVAVEHSFGILKARFPSLDRIPLKFPTPNHHGHFVKWILVSLILHNFLQAAEDSDDYWLEDINGGERDQEFQNHLDWNNNFANIELNGAVDDTRAGSRMRDEFRELFTP